MSSPYEIQDTDAEHRGGLVRSSGEVSVMEMERRGGIIQSWEMINHHGRNH